MIGGKLLRWKRYILSNYHHAAQVAQNGKEFPKSKRDMGFKRYSLFKLASLSIWTYGHHHTLQCTHKRNNIIHAFFKVDQKLAFDFKGFLFISSLGKSLSSPPSALASLVGLDLVGTKC